MHEPPWILDDLRLVKSECQIFCFPYAGGNSTLFRNWKKNLPPQFSVHPIELPGKGRRLHERPYTLIQDLVQDLLKWFLKNVRDEFVIFGHSVGALIGFELAKQLHEFQLALKAVVVSGCSSPCYLLREKERNSKRGASDEEIFELLRLLQGTPEEILQEEDFIKTFLPILKADFSMFDNYSPCLQTQLKCPLIVFGGLQDPAVPVDSLMSWSKHCINKTETRMFEGGHFFLHSSEKEIIENLVKMLE